MNKRDKKTWVSALRSGEYKQGEDYLCRDRRGEARWCCLGVAVDLFLDGDWVPVGDDLWAFRSRLSKKRLAPDEIPYDPAALFIALPESVQRDLAIKNDAGWTFAEIADYIEANL